MKNSMSRFFVTQVHGSRVHGSRLAILGEVREAPPFKAESFIKRGPACHCEASPVRLASESVAGRLPPKPVQPPRERSGEVGGARRTGHERAGLGGFHSEKGSR